MNQEPSVLAAFLPLILIGVFFAIPAAILAKEKGRNPVKWVILSLIPLVNGFCLMYLVGTPSSRIEEKVDLLLKRHGLSTEGQ